MQGNPETGWWLLLSTASGEGIVANSSWLVEPVLPELLGQPAGSTATSEAWEGMREDDTQFGETPSRILLLHEPYWAQKAPLML